MSIVEEIKNKIKELNLQLIEIQNDCSHPKTALNLKNESNTGNYDPTADCYWTNFHCTLCDKRWTKYQ